MSELKKEAVGEDSQSREPLADWLRRARESQHVHYECSNYYSRLHYWIGIPAIVLTTTVSSTLFASFESLSALTGLSIVSLKLLTGLVGLLASIAVALQTFLSPTEQAGQHRLAATGYARVRRQLELLQAHPPKDNEALRREFSDLKRELDGLAQTSPEPMKSVAKRTLAIIAAKTNLLI